LLTLLLVACTPPARDEGKRRPDAPPPATPVRPLPPGGSFGAAAAPAGSPGAASVWAARTSVYAGLASVAVGPLAVAARAARREMPAPPVYELDDKVFLRRSIVELGDPDADGSRAIRIVCNWEDARGNAEDEVRHGVVKLVHGSDRVIEWTSSETLPPDPERWKAFESVEPHAEPPVSRP